MNNLGKICGILSGILAAIIIAVLGIDALQRCLSLSGSAVVVMPSEEWFVQLYAFVHNYGIYILMILSLSQIFVWKTKKGAGIFFIIYLAVSICFVVLIFFPDKVIEFLK